MPERQPESVHADNLLLLVDQEVGCFAQIVEYQCAGWQITCFLGALAFAGQHQNRSSAHLCNGLQIAQAVANAGYAGQAYAP